MVQTVVHLNLAQMEQVTHQALKQEALKIIHIIMELPVIMELPQVAGMEQIVQILPDNFNFFQRAYFSELYKLVAFEAILYSALTDYPLGIKPVISYDTHHKIDAANIAGLVAGTISRDINKEKTTLAFHIGITAIAMITVLLTDWNAHPHTV